MAENEVEQEAPEYHADDFQVVEPIALIIEFLGEQNRELDPDSKVATHLASRRDLLTRAWRIENRILASLSPAMLEELCHDGKLGNLIGNMDRRLRRLTELGRGQSDEAVGLYTALKAARTFALEHGYEPEMIGTLFGLERFEQVFTQSKRAAADQPHGGA
ncbi:hypothetical protein HYZ80_04170 [Candidatus Parcubacteria bacterium]|nr:hypothetical protein [Candidatus Parcubacteria bacterium]